MALLIVTRAAEIPNNRIAALDYWRIIAPINNRDMSAALIEPSPLEYPPAVYQMHHANPFRMNAAGLLGFECLKLG